MSRASAILCLLGLAHAVQAQAPGEQDGESLFDLPTFHVEGYRFTYSTDALPVSTTVVDSERMQRMAQGTLGETLGWEPGVSSSYFGPGASRPVIRGHEGKRVRVLSHGLGSADDSDSSPDHAVSIDPLMLKEARIIRGPTALSYGGSAIGGVVDVKTRYIPEHLPAGGSEFLGDVRYGTAANERTGFVSATVQPFDQWAVRANAVYRKAGDVRIPGEAHSQYFEQIHLHPGEEAEESPYRTLPNSDYDTRNLSLGVSRIAPGLSTGMAISEFRSNYGVPFHAHAHDHDDMDEDISDDPDVRIDMVQRRLEWDSEWRDPFPGFRAMHLRAGYSNYAHRELEDGVAMTEFDRKSWEARGEFAHVPLGNADGAVGFQTSLVDYRAEGAEVFTPATESHYGALFYMNQWSLRFLDIQSSVRYEAQRINLKDFSDEKRSDDSVAASLGLVIPFGDHWHLHLGASSVERVPTATELYASGPHAATQTYEMGDPSIQRERSKGAELMLDAQFSRWQGKVTLYQQDFDRFIYLRRTGFEVQGLPIFQYVQREARFQGVELDVAWVLRAQGPRTQVRLTGDYVRATDQTTNQPIPRIPPMRIGLRLEEDRGPFSWGVEVRHAFAQNRNMPHLEAPTPAFTLLNADIEYRVSRSDQQFIWFLRGSNLGNETARSHSSFLKEVAPLPGRSLMIGLRWER
ncbi:MAG: TonB-dependent receptor [Opitutales bacterium]|nr:TonB-dependent receptor [Opitutales bacterium]